MNVEPERGQIRSLTERLQPWAKYRGRADLIPVTDRPDLPDATVARDLGGRLIVFAQLTAIQEVRLKWEGREIDTIPSDDEIAAWLAWIVIETIISEDARALGETATVTVEGVEMSDTSVVFRLRVVSRIAESAETRID